MEDNVIYTPVPQGTLQARLVWDNDSETDGIEISLIRTNGAVDVLFEVSAGEKGLTYNVALPLSDINEDAVMSVESDEENGILYLESREEGADDDGSDESTGADER